MKCDIVIAGAQGQGISAAATVLTAAAIGSGLHVVQSEKRQVAERETASLIHIRIADAPFDEALCGSGPVDLVLSLDPREAVRLIPSLLPGSALITSGTHDGDPAIDDLLWTVLQLRGGFVVDAGRLAEEAGSVRAANSALLGAAADFLPIEPDQLRAAVAAEFAGMGGHAVEVNLAAFDAGRRSLRHRELVDEFDTFASIGR